MTQRTALCTAHACAVPPGHTAGVDAAPACLVACARSDGNENGSADTTGIITQESRNKGYWYITWEGKQANRYYYRWAGQCAHSLVSEVRMAGYQGGIGRPACHRCRRRPDMCMCDGYFDRRMLVLHMQT